MKTSPALFDRFALQRHRARASDDALFLHVAALDEAQDRLALVKRTFTAPAGVSPFPQVWQNSFPNARIVNDDEVLALEPGAHDLVIHGMCLHWANDPVGQVIQCRRALRPDGLFLCFALGGTTLNELRSALAEAEARITGGLSPRVAPMAELRDLGAVLQRAGLSLPVADSIPLTAQYRDLHHLMRDLRAMGETNATSGRLKRPTQRAVFDTAEEVYRERFATPDGKLPASFEIVSLTAWCPDESQPKPLRPGSASARLADALGSRETRLPD